MFRRASGHEDSLVLIGTVVAWSLQLCLIKYSLFPLGVVPGLFLTSYWSGALLVRTLAPLTRGLERVALSVGLSVVTLIVCVAAASMTAGGITPMRTGLLSATVSLLYCLPPVLSRRADEGPERDEGGRSRTSSRVTRRPQPLLWSLCLTGATLAVSAALVVSIVSEKHALSEPLTQLALTPAGDSGSYLLTIANMEGRAIDYRLQIALDGGQPIEREVTLRDGARYTQTYELRAGSNLTVRLFGGSASPSGYRQVSASVP